METRRLYVTPRVAGPPAEARPAVEEHARPRARRVPILGAGLLGVLVGLAMLLGVMFALQARQRDVIYPGVHVLGVPLAGLTPLQAEAALADHVDRVDAGLLTLTDGERTWSVPWQAMGVRLDTEATARAAFAVGHSAGDRHPRRWLALWTGYQEVPPVLALDVEATRRAIAALAPQVDRPPTAPQLTLSGERVEAVPGAPGRALDVEATLLATIAAAQQGAGAEPLALVFTPLPAALLDTGALQAELERLLAAEVHLSAYELLADRTYTWTLGRQEIAGWVRLEGGDDPATARLVLDEGAIRGSLEGLAATMGEGIGLRYEEAASAVARAVSRGGGVLDLRVTHSPRTYVVQAGDTALAIAERHGMPLWPLIQANPGRDLDLLRPGQQIVIPSQDVLTPHQPVPGKRIVVDLSEQRLRAYENGAVVYDWLCASGREASPTSPGTFQVLSKEENAYASLWDLQMPHFIAVYPAAPDFYNGIHALPILSNGQRLWAGALGTPASYGCIILGVEEAATLYDWVEVGVTVVIQP